MKSNSGQLKLHHQIIFTFQRNLIFHFTYYLKLVLSKEALRMTKQIYPFFVLISVQTLTDSSTDLC